MSQNKNNTMRIIHLFFVIFTTSVIFSQNITQQKKFTLYAEDARGNKDSIVLGYHRDAIEGFEIDTRFDKIIEDAQFNSIFEIRAHKFGIRNNIITDEFQKYGSSKQLTIKLNNYSNISNFYYTPVCFISVKCKYPPFKFSWDKNLFVDEDDPTINPRFSYLFHSLQGFGLIDGPLREVVKPMKYNGFLVDSLDLRKNRSFKEGTNKNIMVKDKDGKTIDTLQANYLFQFGGFTITNTEDQYIQITKIFPNPCQEAINIRLEDSQNNSPNKINVYGVNGSIYNLNNSFENGNITINTSELTPGMYLVEIIMDNQKKYASSFIKE
jgi:hypothetical protein